MIDGESVVGCIVGEPRVHEVKLENGKYVDVESGGSPRFEMRLFVRETKEIQVLDLNAESFLNFVSVHEKTGFGDNLFNVSRKNGKVDLELVGKIPEGEVEIRDRALFKDGKKRKPKEKETVAAPPALIDEAAKAMLAEKIQKLPDFKAKAKDILAHFGVAKFGELQECQVADVLAKIASYEEEDLFA